VPPPATVSTHRSDVWRLVRFTTIDHRLRRFAATAVRLPVVPSFTHGQQTFHRPHEGRPAKSLQFGSRVERVVHRRAYRCAREVTPSEGLCASTAVELTEKWSMDSRRESSSRLARRLPFRECIMTSMPLVHRSAWVAISRSWMPSPCSHSQAHQGERR
jgi:hypothetical protein